MRLISWFQNNEKPLDWPCDGTTNASEALKRFTIKKCLIDEFLVSEIKHTCALVDVSRRVRCTIFGLRRLPPEPRQFHARNVTVPLAPLRLALEPRSSSWRPTGILTVTRKHQDPASQPNRSTSRSGASQPAGEASTNQERSQKILCPIDGGLGGEEEGD